MRQNAYCVNHTKYITKRGWKKEISFNVEGKDKSEQSVVAQTQNKHNAYLIRKEPSEKPNSITYNLIYLALQISLFELLHGVSSNKFESILNH